MGKKAKLKQTRRDRPHSQPQTKPSDFVTDLQKQGYQLQQITQAPEIPQEKIYPQI